MSCLVVKCAHKISSSRFSMHCLTIFKYIFCIWCINSCFFVVVRVTENKIVFLCKTIQLFVFEFESIFCNQSFACFLVVTCGWVRCAHVFVWPGTAWPKPSKGSYTKSKGGGMIAWLFHLFPFYFKFMLVQEQS